MFLWFRGVRLYRHYRRRSEEPEESNTCGHRPLTIHYFFGLLRNFHRGHVDAAVLRSGVYSSVFTLWFCFILVARTQTLLCLMPSRRSAGPQPSGSSLSEVFSVFVLGRFPIIRRCFFFTCCFLVFSEPCSLCHG